MKNKRIEIIINDRVSSKFKDFFSNRNDNLKHTENMNISHTGINPIDKEDISIYVEFEGIVHDDYASDKYQIKITCAITNGNKVEIKNKTASNYFQTHRVFEITFNDILYIITIKPQIKKEYTNNHIYHIFKNTYNSCTTISTEDIVIYTNLNNLKNKLFLCLVLFACNISVKTTSYTIRYILGRKLSYYGYNSIDIKDIEENIRNCENINELADLLLSYIYTISDGTVTDTITDKKYYAELIATNYNSIK